MGFEIRVSGLRIRIWGSGFMESGLGIRVIRDITPQEPNGQEMENYMEIAIIW